MLKEITDEYVILECDRCGQTSYAQLEWCEVTDYLCTECLEELLLEAKDD
jgi:hypothetical protein